MINMSHIKHFRCPSTYRKRRLSTRIKKYKTIKKPGVRIETERGERKTTQDMQSHISLFNGSFVNDFSLFCGFTSKGLLFK